MLQPMHRVLLELVYNLYIFLEKYGFDVLMTYFVTQFKWFVIIETGKLNHDILISRRLKYKIGFYFILLK